MTDAQETAGDLAQIYIDQEYYYKPWDGEYEEEAVVEYEEESTVTESSETSEDSAIINAFLTGFEQRDKMMAARALEKQKRLEKLLGAVRKMDDGTSVETIITPEEWDIAPEKAISVSSIHPCLKDIDISDSQMKLTNLETSYPEPNDPGLWAAFNVLTVSPTFEEGGIYKFADHLLSKGLKPIGSIVKMLDSDCINLRYYGIDPRVVEIVCYAIRNNASIQTIELTDNLLDGAACGYLGILLQKNTLANLILSMSRIGPEGVQGLHDGLAMTSSLIKLDLNACNLREKGLEILASALRDNQSVEELCLANNELSVECTQHLSYLIVYSKSIKWLDLSWNSLYQEATWKELAKAIPHNFIMISLNVAWNGIGHECINYFAVILRRSQLEILDLSSNRFTQADADVISKALSRNDVLEEFYFGSNLLGTVGALILISALTLEAAPDSRLRLLNLENVWAGKEALPDLEKIENEKPWLQIVLGGVFSAYELKGPDVQKILLRRATYEAMAQKQKKRRRNFGHFVLTLEDKPIRKVKFRQLIKAFKLKLSKSLIDEIMSAFPGAKKTVDQALMKAVYMEEFPDTKLPPEKPSKKKPEPEVKEEEVPEPKRKSKVKRKKDLERDMDEGEDEYDWYDW